MSNIKSLGNLYSKTKQSNKIQTLDPIKTFPEEVTKIVDVTDLDEYIVFLSSEGKLYQTHVEKYHEKLKAFENLPPMKSIASGYYHFLALSNEEKPRVYGWGQNLQKQLGFTSNNYNYFEKPTLIEPLKEENIGQICCIGYCSFFLNKTTNVLFGCGNTEQGKLGKPEIEEEYVDLQKLHENVANVFGGHSDHTLMIKTDGKLYGFGSNLSGELGLGHKKNALKPTQIKLEFPVEDISKIRLAYRLTSILTNDGKLYVTGNQHRTGFGSDLTEFKQYPQFKNNNTIIQEIDCGYYLFAILTQENEIWVQGTYDGLYSENSSVITKIQTGTNLTNEISSYNQMKCCNEDLIYFFLESNSYLSQDLGKLLKNGYFSDCNIQDIPVHKILIETRIGKTFDLIKKYLESNCKLNEIQDLLKWIYCDQMINSKRTNEILNHFGIQNAQKTKLLKNDLKQLLFDEQTSDFKLVVKNEEDEEEELYIHKFILAARSGLFLNMFQNIEENLQKVKDYSRKSLETIELLITFLYTDELPITADTDQEFIKEEFEDIVEYYQLNPRIPMMDIFKKYSKI
ncbi:btk-binding protein-related [Anaeramoeba flamelloides]|uniref:Btk-binding protein-related n=1 Tax=Anaeramoeba flamelloides TaxID=1746091 RepID=A0ABQ8Y5R0_9EUKA|nr:btk-binding protein-related [Anaeramoeba flamelloides]